MLCYCSLFTLCGSVYDLIFGLLFIRIMVIRVVLRFLFMLVIVGELVRFYVFVDCGEVLLM